MGSATSTRHHRRGGLSAQERVRELGKQARERIDADFNVNDPNTPPRAS
jgi:hypothetical protein